MVNETRKTVPVQFSDRSLAFPSMLRVHEHEKRLLLMHMTRLFSNILKEDEARGENERKKMCVKCGGERERERESAGTCHVFFVSTPEVKRA